MSRWLSSIFFVNCIVFVCEFGLVFLFFLSSFFHFNPLFNCLCFRLCRRAASLHTNTQAIWAIANQNTNRTTRLRAGKVRYVWLGSTFDEFPSLVWCQCMCKMFFLSPFFLESIFFIFVIWEYDSVLGLTSGLTLGLTSGLFFFLVCRIRASDSSWLFQNYSA